ncbi:MAG: hypothetical protein JXA77_02090, partial [Bacteroidales bacterium]|nr:hypothetical protein [Bacteroidales bacterium]
MKKSFLILFLALALSAISSLSTKAVVVFDASTYAGSLPANMSIVNIEGRDYLQVILNGSSQTLMLDSPVDIPVSIDHYLGYYFRYGCHPDSTNSDYRTYIYLNGSSDTYFMDLYCYETFTTFSYINQTESAFTVSSISFQGIYSPTGEYVSGDTILFNQIRTYEKYHEEPLRIMSPISEKTSSITIDGVGSETDYSSSELLLEYFRSSGWDASAADFSGSFKLTYDWDNLYLFADISDDIAVNYDGSGDVWSYDNVEIYLDMDTTITNQGKYIGDERQLRYNRGYDYYTDPAPRNGVSLENFVQADGSGSWQLEVAIPWLAFLPEGTLHEDIFDSIDINAIGFDIHFA